MIKLLFMFSVMLLGIVFLLVPDSDAYDFFLYADMRVTAEWYMYYILQHIIIIIFAFYLLEESDEYRIATTVFFIVQILELIDFLLTYNMAWFFYGDYPITFNVIKVLLFTLAIAYEYSRNTFASKA